MNKRVTHELVGAWWLGISALCFSQIHGWFAFFMGCFAWYCALQQSKRADSCELTQEEGKS